ncbi:MAG: hypothetical protein IBJ03_06130 [Gemmatimonadaceae bacterium]|nr:hypothetical protein [Gemmatimonadaceae bacterium]
MLASVFGLMLALMSARRGSTGHQVPDATPATLGAYDGAVQLDLERATLSGQWRVRESDTTTDSTVLLLNGGLTVDTVHGLWVASHATRVERGLTQLTVQWKSGAPRDQRIVHLATHGALQLGEDRINSLSVAWTELGLDSFWYPVFADFAHDVTGTVRVTIPRSANGARMALRASGALTQRGDTVVITNHRPLPDFAFVAAPVLSSSTRETGSGKSRARVSVHHVNATDADVQRYLETTSRCTAWLNARYGVREPIADAGIVLAPRTGPGYARAGYIVISAGELSRVDTMPNAALRADVARSQFICHELAHYWSTGAVSNGPENWLNEGFAEFVSMRAVRALHGDSVYTATLARYTQLSAKQPPVWRADIVSRPNAMVAYRKAPVLLDSLARRVGETDIERILTQFLAMPAPRTTPKMLAIVEAVAGRETREWFETALGR